ncbi:MAG: flagellar hook-length control protein FliK [Telluria sp.]
MLRPDFTAVLPVGAADPVLPAEPVADARQEAFERSLSGLVGKTVRAEVLAKLTDGTALVRVAGNAARLPLPEGATVGSHVELTLVTLSPRPTFEVAGAGTQALAEAGPALLPGPEGVAARGQPLVYLDGAATPARPAPATTGTPVQAAGATAADTADAAAATAAADAAGPRVPVAAASVLPQPPPGFPPELLAELPPVVLPPGLPAAPEDAAAERPPAPPAAGAQQAEAQAGLPLPTGAPRNPFASTAAALAGKPAVTPQQLRTAYGAALLGKAPIIPAELLPEIDPHSTPSHLSEGAQVLTTVLATAARAPAQAAVTAPAPVLPPGETRPAAIASALQDAVAQSGLFYESHLKEWNAGQRDLAQIAQEPQARGQAEGAPVRTGQPVDAATAAFVNLQLSTQEQGRVVWQGQLWPGTAAQWQIQRDAPERQDSGGGAPEPAWRSGMRLRFGALGEINATVVLHQGQARIQVEAGDEPTATLLRAHAAALAEALGAAGTPLAGLDVSARGAPHD